MEGCGEKFFIPNILQLMYVTDQCNLYSSVYASNCLRILWAPFLSKRPHYHISYTAALAAASSPNLLTA